MTSTTKESTTPPAVEKALGRLDLATAELHSRWVNVADPYAEGNAHEECIGTLDYLADPVERVGVFVEDVRDAHPEISEDAWKDLRAGAAERGRNRQG